MLYPQSKTDVLKINNLKNLVGLINIISHVTLEHFVCKHFNLLRKVLR